MPSSLDHVMNVHITDATQRLQVVRIKRKRGDAAVEEIILDALHVPSKLARVDGLAQLMAAASLAPTRAPTRISTQDSGVQAADEHSRSRRRFKRVHTLTADALKKLGHDEVLEMAACWAQHASSRRLLSSERPSAAAAPFTHPPNTASHTTSTQQDPVQDMHPSAYSSDFHIQQTVPGSSTSTVSGSENRDPHSGSSSKTALQIPVIEPGGVGSGGAAQGRRVMKPPGRRAAAAVAAVHLGPHATSGIAKPAAQTAVARPTAVFKQVHGLTQQQRHRGHQTDAPRKLKGSEPASVQDPFQQLFRVFDVEQSTSSSVSVEANRPQTLAADPLMPSKDSTQPQTVLLDEAYVLSRFLPMLRDYYEHGTQGASGNGAALDSAMVLSSQQGDDMMGGSGEDFMYDVFVEDMDSSSAEASMELSSSAPVIEVIDDVDEEEGRWEEECAASEHSEDSNAESYYGNSYPDKEQDDESSSSGDDEGQHHASRGGLANSGSDSGSARSHRRRPGGQQRESDEEYGPSCSDED